MLKKFFFIKILNIINVLNKKKHKKIILIITLSFLVSIFEVIGTGLIIPILSLFVGNEHSEYLNYINFLNIKNKEQILIIFLIAFFLVHVLKFFINKSTIYLQNRLCHDLYADLSKKLYKNYIINNDYIFFVDNNSSKLIRNIVTECNIFAFQVFLNILKLISTLLIVVSLSVLLLVINLKVTLIISFYFLIIALVIYKLSSLNLINWGIERQDLSSKILKHLQETFNSYRELVINGFQENFLKKFNFFTEKFSQIGYLRDTTVSIPRLIFEIATIFLLITIIIYLILIGEQLEEIFILIGVIMYASVRIMPLSNMILKTLQIIKNQLPVINLISEQLNFKDNKYTCHEDVSSKDFKFKNIKLQKVSYYFKKKQFLLENISLQIDKFDKIGLIGGSGSGKSTLINLICGLLEPLEGKVFINDEDIFNIKKKYQNKISYVPQKVTIFDESVLFNITLEEDLEKINKMKLDKILKEVNLFDFFYNLPENLQIKAGENGSNLSGGQCQRIGIARALYLESEIIIFDEATSALDDENEKNIFNIIFKAYKNRTIIISTHRLEALKECNKVFKIKDKKIINLKNQ